MESSLFAHKEVVKLDFHQAYHTLRHDAGVLLRTIRALGHLLPSQPGAPARPRAFKHDHC